MPVVSHPTDSEKHSRKPDAPRKMVPEYYRPLFYISLVALVIVGAFLFLALFEPGLPYAISQPQDLNSNLFVRTLGALTGATPMNHTTVDVLTNGENYYPAELDAVRKAQKTINLEAYIFQKGRVTKPFIDAFTERARAGVKVNLLIDAIGSASFSEDNLDEFKKAGGKVAWYHPLRWYTWPRMNNRTHRELLVIDGRVGFIGGSGWADHWMYEKDGDKRWRDTMARVEGDAVSALQATFAENWLESKGEVILGQDYFPFQPAEERTVAMVVGSSPSTGRSTEARILFQALMSSAKKNIYITTPYFLPDRSIRDELARAVKERGVDVRIVVPGKKSDHSLTRSSSRRLYGELLKAGAHIYEYRPSMIHCKSLIIDGHWTVLGSTNLDSRSFGLNDEVNIASKDPGLAARLEQDFQKDVSESREISYEEWKNRPLLERGQEFFGALIERQQ